MLLTSFFFFCTFSMYKRKKMNENIQGLFFYFWYKLNANSLISGRMWFFFFGGKCCTMWTVFEELDNSGRFVFKSSGQAELTRESTLEQYTGINKGSSCSNEPRKAQEWSSRGMRMYSYHGIGIYGTFTQSPVITEMFTQKCSSLRLHPN